MHEQISNILNLDLYKRNSKQGLAISSSQYLHMLLTFLPCFSIRTGAINSYLSTPTRYAHANAIIITANNLSILSRCVSSTLKPLDYITPKHIPIYHLFCNKPVLSMVYYMIQWFAIMVFLIDFLILPHIDNSADYSHNRSV